MVSSARQLGITSTVKYIGTILAITSSFSQLTSSGHVYAQQGASERNPPVKTQPSHKPADKEISKSLEQLFKIMQYIDKNVVRLSEAQSTAIFEKEAVAKQRIVLYGPRAIPALIQALNMNLVENNDHKKGTYYFNICHALVDMVGQIGGQDAYRYLETLTADNSPMIREASQHALNASPGYIPQPATDQEVNVVVARLSDTEKTVNGLNPDFDDALNELLSTYKQYSGNQRQRVIDVLMRSLRSRVEKTKWQDGMPSFDTLKLLDLWQWKAQTVEDRVVYGLSKYMLTRSNDDLHSIERVGESAIPKLFGIIMDWQLRLNNDPREFDFDLNYLRKQIVDLVYVLRFPSQVNTLTRGGIADFHANDLTFENDSLVLSVLSRPRLHALIVSHLGSDKREFTNNDIMAAFNNMLSDHNLYDVIRGHDTPKVSGSDYNVSLLSNDFDLYTKELMRRAEANVSLSEQEYRRLNKMLILKLFAEVFWKGGTLTTPGGYLGGLGRTIAEQTFAPEECLYRDEINELQGRIELFYRLSQPNGSQGKPN